MAGRLRRTVAALSLVVLLLPLAGATSLAAKPIEVFKFTSSGHTAFAEAGTCSDPVDDIVTCSFRNISLVSGKSREQGSGAIHGTEVCYGTFTNVFNEETGETVSFSGESGCTMDLGEGSVIERDLSAAIIAPATITLETIVCDAIECAPTGESARSRSKARSRRPRLDALVLPQRLRRRRLHLPRTPGGRNGMRRSRAPPMANRWRSGIPTGLR